MKIIKHNMQENFSRNSIIQKTTVVVLIIVLAAVAYYAYRQIFGGQGASYQAVFLSNGQVYFGKASDIRGDYVKLTDIYYLQLTQALQPQQPPANGSQNNQQLMLMKLGNELHGPLDKMLINRGQITFIEDLKDSSQVVAAIMKHKAQNK